MRLQIVLRYVGVVLLIFAGFMLASACIAWISGPDSSFYPLLLSAMLTALLGAFPLIFVQRQEKISSKEGFCIVVGSWLVACVVGMFPYLIWGGEFSLINAWFESVSGLTTTGASILTDIEALPRGLLFWRNSTAWVGGIGVVLFALLILPAMGRSKRVLSNVEISSIAKDDFHYRTQSIVQIILSVYVGITIISTLMLKLSGMNWFDSLNHAMSAAATCGFSTKNLSIAFFDSAIIESVLICTMLISGIHFGLIYTTITGRRDNIWRSEVTRSLLYFILFGSIAIALSLWINDIYPTFWSSLRHAAFQFVALVTTSGFATADTNTWTSFAIILLIFGSIVCASAGSTSGGLKFNRLFLAGKMLISRLKHQQHPNAVIRVRVDGVIQEDETIHTAMVFIVTYMMFILLGTLINTLFGNDLMTGFSSAVACIGNVGPGFGDVGSMSNYSSQPIILKFSSTMLMLFGRLEIFGLVQLFFLKWWR
ncbi:MAG: TrkH family potassium uptake protein [Alistipes sp.]|nr:TrkH family potassium uptake protein [Alistipes sp.]